METFRAFIAIGLGAEVRNYLGEAGEELAKLLPERSVRWVRPTSIHLTLRFLGDVNVERTPDIVLAMDQIAALSEPFDLKLDKLGCFPNQRRPRVIWVGMNDEKKQLQTLQRAVQDELVNLGWKRENKPFHPHLTLGRVKDKRAVVEAALPWGQPANPMVVPVDSFHLFESRLHASGAVYSIRHSSLLRVVGPGHV